MPQDMQHPVHPAQFIMQTNPAWSNAPAANTPAVVTFAAVPGRRHSIYKPYWSYNALVPAGGQLSFTCGGMRIAGPFYITNGGPGWLDLEVEGLLNQDLTITLAAGGVGCTGSVGVEKYWFRVR
jgi:hypothetical protein